jgi:hypothetical protein
MLIVTTMLIAGAAHAQYADPQGAVSGLLQKHLDPNWLDGELARLRAESDARIYRQQRDMYEHPELYPPSSGPRTCIAMPVADDIVAVDCD